MTPSVSRDLSSLLPPLCSEAFAALKADIEANGIRDSVIVDEDGVVLDGHNRLRIDPKAPTRVVSGLSPGEKEAFAFRANVARRNLSPDQRRALHVRMKQTAATLRAEDPKRWTQAAVAAALGVARRREAVKRGLSKKRPAAAPARRGAAGGPGVRAGPRRARARKRRGSTGKGAAREPKNSKT
ncbi:MAG: hypothetical protein JXA90_16795 [Planctomycetes bacterium]|nr:hypothetical protein [Planctomycetota bacterium]